LAGLKLFSELTLCFFEKEPCESTSQRHFFPMLRHIQKSSVSFEGSEALPACPSDKNYEEDGYG
jgi:hypothetical protein